MNEFGYHTREIKKGTLGQLSKIEEEFEELPEESKAIVTNPPYAMAKEFVEHSLDLLETGEYCIMLLKIQFLEGKARRKLFETKQLKHVWVFSERQKCLKNNEDS